VAGLDVPSLTLKKVTPMVRGLSPEHERGPVLGLLAHSVVFSSLVKTSVIKSSVSLTRSCMWC
jgi:hypothetical protein